MNPKQQLVAVCLLMFQLQKQRQKKERAPIHVDNIFSTGILTNQLQTISNQYVYLSVSWDMMPDACLPTTQFAMMKCGCHFPIFYTFY